MRCIYSILFTLCALCVEPCLAQQESSAKPTVKKQKIKMVEGLRYSPARFSVKGQGRLELTLENHDPNDQPHNLVLIRPDALAEIQQASMEIGPEVVARGYVPDHEAVIVASGLLKPDGKETLVFDLPEKQGVYYYVCTFPGHAQVMYGALYVNTRWKGELKEDPHVPELVRQLEMQKTQAIFEVERPAVARGFMPDAGPAAIAVALPGQQNFCWDAGNCRLRYAWAGHFVDRSRMLRGNGNALVEVLGETYWRSGGGEKTFGVQFGDQPADEVDFRGYRLIEGVPEFHYRVDGTAVRERLSSGDEGGLAWQFAIDDAPAEVRILAPSSDGITVSSGQGRRDGEYWLLSREEASSFTLQLSQP